MGRKGDLTVTALYTSGAWTWAEFPAADLLASRESRRVFNATNNVMALARLLRPRTPSLRHSLVQRHAMIDAIARQSACPQVLEIAAGLSPRGAALSESRTYVEVDLPAMVARKRELLGRSDGGRAVLARSSYRLVGGDARDVDLAALVDPALPLLVIGEGLFMYLKADEQRALWTRIAALVARAPGSSFVFDLVPRSELPTPGIVGGLLRRGLEAATGGKGFVRDDRTRDELRRDVLACGFADVTLLEPRTALASWSIPHLQERTQVLIFHCRGGAGPS